MRPGHGFLTLGNADPTRPAIEPQNGAVRNLNGFCGPVPPVRWRQNVGEAVGEHSDSPISAGKQALIDKISESVPPAGPDTVPDVGPPPKTARQPRKDTAWAWLFRGIVVGALIIGAANALSFFFRSKGWGGLLGRIDPHDEAIGFPWTIWRESGGYGTHGLQTLPFVGAIGLALLLGSGLGLLAMRGRAFLNHLMTRMESNSQHQVQMQFSLSGLMITTVLCAFTAALIKAFEPRVEMLMAIYVGGPAALIALAFLPRKLSWQQRVGILTPMAFATIAAAITLGLALKIDFDKVLMGIFICWTPQAAIGALLLSAWIMLREYREMHAEGRPVVES